MPVPSVTYWHRIEPSPRSDGLEAGLAAAVRDPLWFLTRQWQLGEFQGEDAASPAFTTITTSTSTLDGWRTGNGSVVHYDGSAPLEAVIEVEPMTPDLRAAVELGQALENRLGGAADGVIAALRSAYPVPRPDELSVTERRDQPLVRLASVCGGRSTHGINALTELRAAAPGLPARLQVPAGTEASVAAAAAWFIAWTDAFLGSIGTEDAPAWRPDRLEYAFSAAARTPDGVPLELAGHAGTHGEFDWYAFDETSRGAVASGGSTSTTTVSLLPTPVRFSGMPDPRWWTFEDSRVNWSGVDTDRRDLARLIVVDFMLVQGTDWFLIPFGHEVGSLIRVSQLLVRDVFGELTLIERADAQAGTGRQRWTMFSTLAADGGLADYAFLPPSALRTTLDGPDLEEVRFLRDEQANLVWAVEAITEDGTGRPLPGNQRAALVPEPEPAAATSGLPYRLQTTVPVNWIPFLPVQIDDTRRAVALERAAMQRDIDGVVTAVSPAGRVLRPHGVDVYRIPEEEVPRGGTRVLRAVRRTRWLDGSTQLWTARRRRAGQGGAASGLRYDVVDGP